MRPGMHNDQADGARQAATLVYALQAASFLLAITFVAAVIVNYLRQGDVAGTWVASHFRWQIRTFWFALLWSLLGLITLLLGIGYLILIAVAVWVVYRIAKGWLALADGKPMYPDG
jgi:uncharacterized membrane protein